MHLKGCTKLESLCLAHTSITNAGLKHIEPLTKLRRLDLSNTRVTDNGLASMVRLAGLEELKLCYNFIWDDGVSHLTPLTALKSLDLRATKLSDQGLMELGRMSQLRELRVGPGHFTTAGIGYLANLRNLEILDLSRSDASENAYRGSRLPATPSIEIHARSSPYNLGFRALARMTKLRELRLVNSWITDEYVTHLAGLTKLRILDLSPASRITDEGLLKLQGLRELRELKVGRTNISVEAVCELQSMLPQTRILEDIPAMSAGDGR